MFADQIPVALDNWVRYGDVIVSETAKPAKVSRIKGRDAKGHLIIEQSPDEIREVWLVGSGSRLPVDVINANEAEEQRLWAKFAGIVTVAEVQDFAARYGLLGLAGARCRAVIVNNVKEKSMVVPRAVPTDIVTLADRRVSFDVWWAHYHTKPADESLPRPFIPSELIESKFTPNLWRRTLALSSDVEPISEWEEEIRGMRDLASALADEKEITMQRQLVARLFAGKVHATPAPNPDVVGGWKWEAVSLIDALWLLAFLDIGLGNQGIFKCPGCLKFFTTSRLEAGKTAVIHCRVCGPKQRRQRWEKANQNRDNTRRRLKRMHVAGSPAEEIIEAGIAAGISAETVQGWLRKWQASI